MDNLEIYKQQINTIFSCLEKLKSTLPTQDNLNFISNLNEYRQDVIEFSNLIEELSKEKKEETK